MRKIEITLTGIVGNGWTFRLSTDDTPHCPDPDEAYPTAGRALTKALELARDLPKNPEHASCTTPTSP